MPSGLLGAVPAPLRCAPSGGLPVADPSGAPVRTGALGIFGDPGGSVKGFLSYPIGNLMFVLCGLDLDGVLCDLGPPVASRIARRFGVATHPSAWTRYDLRLLDLGLPRAPFLAFLDETFGDASLYAEARPADGAAFGVAALRAAGWSIVGITARPGHLADVTASWLDAHGLGLDEGALEDALAGPAAEFELVVAVRAIDDDVPSSPEGEAWTVSVYGSDRPGIVHRVALLLADSGVNIVDLSTRVIGDAERPVYATILEVTLPATGDAAALQCRLAELASDLGVECSLHPSGADIL